MWRRILGVGALALGVLVLTLRCAPAPEEETAVAPGPEATESNPYAPLVAARSASELAALSFPTSLTDASWFAWTQFVSLNWPAACTGPDANCVRDVADGSATLGSNFNTTSPNSSTPVAWMTYRNKTEVYTAGGPNPSGYTTDPNQQNTQGTGYSTLPPNYIYVDASSVPPCTSSNIASGVQLNNDQPAVSSPAFVNLEETNQIGRNQMFAGVVDPVGGGDALQEKNLIRFLAKTNFDGWKYVVTTPSGESGGTLSNDTTATSAEATNVQGVQTMAATYSTNGAVYSTSGTQSINFPSPTIELKTAWRRLTSTEATSGRFVTANVRYYHPTNTGGQCYVESNDQNETWGMVALHIIQKTDAHPEYFTFATFGQIDNIVDANGNPLENAAGGPQGTQPANPTDPAISSNPDFATGQPQGETSYVQQTFTPPYTDPTDCSDLNEQLYYINSNTDQSPQGSICFEKRWHEIPSEVQSVNSAAQAQVANLGPFAYYRLVSVQWQPFTWKDIDADSDHPAAVYYLANEVVETNYNLQSFRGGQVRGGTGEVKGLINDFFNPNDTSVNTIGPYFNTYIYNGGTWTVYNMGGCMGCHGVAETNGGDFSFTLAFNSTANPETFEPGNADLSQTIRADYVDLRK